MLSTFQPTGPSISVGLRKPRADSKNFQARTPQPKNFIMESGRKRSEHSPSLSLSASVPSPKRSGILNPLKESAIVDLEKEPFIIKAGLTRKDNPAFYEELFHTVAGNNTCWAHEEWGDGNKVFGLCSFWDRMFVGRGLRVKIPKRTQKKIAKLTGVEDAEIIVHETGDDADVEIAVIMKRMTKERIESASAKRA